MKKKSIAAALLAAAVALGSLTVTGVSAKVETNYGQDAYAYVQYLDENLNARRAGTDQEPKAAAYIKCELESFGYQVTEQPFEYVRGQKTVSSKNLVAVKPGKSSKEIIVGSHYDSVNTHGVDDNGSGVSVNLETAKRMIGVDTPYTIKFVFFGAEEAGLRGSRAYAEAMTAEEIENTVLMVNMDTILAGDFCYMYGGYVENDGNVVRTWGVEQAKELADQLALDIRLQMGNNPDYPSPTTGSWSDHASFWEQIPYVYFEAVNWDIPPYDGSGETAEQGEIMHTSKDDLSFINETWPGRAQQTLANYCTLLPAMLTQLSPDGLISNTNKTILSRVLDYADGAVEAGQVDQLIPSVKETFLAAYNAAKDAAADPLADQDSINQAAFALINEIQKLDFVMGDKGVLQSLADFANGLDLNKYIAAGKEEFTAALAAANAVLADEDAMQYEIEPAFDSLLSATENLRLKADKSLLEATVDAYSDIDLTDYSGESVAAFNLAMANAQALLADNGLTDEDQETVNNAVDVLRAAKAALTAEEPTDVPSQPAPPVEEPAGDTIQAEEETALCAAPVQGDANVKTTAKAPKTGDAGVPLAAAAFSALALAATLTLKRKK